MIYHKDIMLQNEEETGKFVEIIIGMNMDLNLAKKDTDPTWSGSANFFKYRGHRAHFPRQLERGP